jgi:hypothetical protein
VRERFDALVVVVCAVEDDVARFEILFLETLIRQQVILVSLVPLAKCESELGS